jgi:ATP-dependent DNA helicase RecG
MTPTQLSALLIELLALPHETEWVEFKENVTDPDMIGQRISGLANAAALSGRSVGYQVWGVEDGTHKVTGTSFKPQKAKKGGEALVNYLMRMLTPQVDFHFHEWQHDGHAMVLLEVPAASHQPVRFSGHEYVRISSHTKPLKEHPEKERLLWATFNKTPFEKGIAKADLPGDEVLALLDFAGCFDLLKIPLPTDQKGILARLADEKLIVAKPGRRFDITNLGAILFAKTLPAFERLSRKALRVIKYKDTGRTDTEREWRDPPSLKGYAVAFEAAVAFINSQLPQNEPIGKAFSTEVRMYPEKAIRELVANALVHQDFSVTGAGPMVEIFTDRMEVTNPGEPLVDTQRFIDTPPRSRNEDLAALMRRMKICEEGGTGIDKVVASVEAFQLPAPDFTAITTTQPGSTKATLYAHQKLTEMDSKDRIRACYQHACLLFVMNKRMTNPSLRERFGIKAESAAQASRLIREAVNSGLVKLYDAEVRDRDRSYVPFWA